MIRHFEKSMLVSNTDKKSLHNIAFQYSHLNIFIKAASDIY